MPTRAEVERALEDPNVVLVFGHDGRPLAERDPLPTVPTATIVFLTEGPEVTPGARRERRTVSTGTRSR